MLPSKNPSFVKHLSLCAAALLALPLTSYGVTTHNYSPTGSPFSTGMTHTDKATTFNVPTFNEQLGSLEGVTLTLKFITDTSFTVKNLDNNTESYSKAKATFAPSATLSYPGETSMSTINEPTTSIGPKYGTLAPGATDYYSGQSNTITESFAVPFSDFSYFMSPTGSTTVPITIDLLENTKVKGTGNDIYFGANDCLEATLCVNYLYVNCGCDCAPEPSTVAMSLVGLVFFGLLFGRRARQLSANA